MMSAALFAKDMVMTALLSRTAAALRMMVPSGPARVSAEACTPDCRFEFVCDSASNYLSRLCCFHPNCTYFCEGWQRVGTC
jgi:hypothetical protein